MKFWLMGVSAVALLGGALAMGVAAESGDKLAPGLSVAGVDVGGLTRTQALALLDERAAAAPQVTITADGKTWTLGADQLGWSADARASVTAAERATAARNLGEKLQGMIGQAQPQDFPVTATVDAAAAKAALSTLTASLNTQPKNATVAFDNKTLKYVVATSDAPGRRYDAAAAATAYAATPKSTTIQIPVKEWKAQHTAADLQGYVTQGNALLRPFGVTLDGTAHKGVLTPLQVANLYWVRPEGVVPDEPAMKRAFALLTNYIDQPVQNARFTSADGKLVKVKEKAGRVAQQSAYQAFRDAVLDPAKSSMVFASKKVVPALTVAGLPDASKLTLIHTGVSTYYHSSLERRTNVANAAAKINGAVVPVGGGFSFLDSLGSITEGNGFVGGLIISGGRTVDGLGGGVCQVSTTVFRALYGAGLPVLERNQHSYRVGYYEPQVGFEAAVYDPGVDLKLKNDTGGPLLITTVNDDASSRLEVQVWGVKQTRTVAVSPAVILNRTAHPPAKYVTNAALRPGTTKQVDWAQDGYNLYITRTIRDAGVVKTDKTSTVYKPWQAVYEVGPS
ncbi:VanW family protein [Deinococcus arenicola]|uniref:VanW family protein n=1 Tax=Deinococcus arenicola TaxID=2994950 RepID=A0ABU4DV22_9DEIO|nr:VanW family protein [Deinococcus sp. ZS9-10]MDV6375802.1 VanW family protein [Deinococcus sp. ZS9-10]